MFECGLSLSPAYSLQVSCGADSTTKSATVSICRAVERDIIVKAHCGDAGSPTAGDGSITVLAGSFLPNPRDKSLRSCRVSCVFIAKRVAHHLFFRMNT
jgi:hypothetical protein